MKLSMMMQRLVLPAAMWGFLVLSLAYWWLDNGPHEVFGTALFALLAWHIGVNGAWFKALLRGRYTTRRSISVGLHMLLIVNMVVLLVSSIVISKSVFAALPIESSTLLREVHLFSAYWVMMIVGVHLGLHWGRVMATMRAVLRLSAPNRIRTVMLRVAVMLSAAFGVWSWSSLDVWNKLTFTYSLEFWDFTASVSPFFVQWAGVVSLPAIAAYYMITFLKKYNGNVMRVL